MRSILVHADRSPELKVRLDTALSLARMHSGHVTLLVDTPVQRFISTDPYGTSYVAQGPLQDALADDDLLADQLAETLQAEGTPFDVVHHEEAPLTALASAARLADLVVLSRECGMAGDLAIETTTPVLALSAHHPLAFPLASICVAWNGGEEAARSLRAAVPLMAGAATVHVLTVATDTNGFPQTDALRYLSRHGIKAELHELPCDNSVEETLLTACNRFGAQALVMGAYSHNRVREFLFGGVTRYFLSEASAPALFLTH